MPRSNVLPTVRITWSSANLAVARVEPDARQPGVATIVGVSPGIALIEVQAGGRKGTVQVQVAGAGGVTPPVTPPGTPAVTSTAVALRIDPNSVYLLPSEDARLNVSFLQADGSPAAAMPITWTSFNATVASIGSDGSIVGISPGQGVVEARTTTGLVARATVFVAPAPFAFGVDVMSLAPGQQDTVPVVVPSQGNRPVATRWLTWTSTNAAVASVTPPPTATSAPPRGPGIDRWEFSCTGGALNFTVIWVDNANNETGYRIFRNGEQIVELPPDTTTYTDVFAVSPDQRVEYFVQVYSPFGTANSSVMPMRCGAS